MGIAKDVFEAATDHGDLRFYLFNKERLLERLLP